MVEDAYPDLSPELDESKQSPHVRTGVLENRAPTTPLFHLGVASVLSGWVVKKGRRIYDNPSYRVRYHVINSMG